MANTITTAPPPMSPIEITAGLTLTPRIRLDIIVNRNDTSVALIDEWKLKRSLIDFFSTSFSHPISITEEDLAIRRFKDAKKRKREDPVAQGSVFIRDLGFVKVRGGGEDSSLQEKLSEWKKVIVQKMDGMEVNLEGVMFRLSVKSPVSDEFERMKKDWEEHFALGSTRGYSRGAKHEPDTLVLRGLPSRWFAETRLSSKPSMLVTHTIISTLGKIRNLDVAEDNVPDNDADEDGTNLTQGLNCKIVVQFEKYSDFCNAMKILCGRSLQKEGSRLKADYDLSWDKNGFFRSGRNSTQDKSSWAASHGQYRKEVSRRQSYHSQYSPETPDHARSKRFKE